METGRVWEELLFFGHCVGGNLEIHERGGILRGRIVCFQIDYQPFGIVRFYVSGITQFNPDVLGGWEKINWPIDQPMLGLIIDEATPEMDSNGNIQIVPRRSKRKLPVTIYPLEIKEGRL